MAKDYRLTDPSKSIEYTKDPFVKKRQLNFDELFQAPASSGQYPWNPSRFTQADLLRKMMTRKLALNPGLNFVGRTAEEYQVFAGIPNFNRNEQYDFANGRAITSQRPEEQPDFNPLWPDSYRLSPTIPPEKKIKNPMPRAENPDPKGNLMRAANQQVDSELSGKISIAELMSRGSSGAPLSTTGKTVDAKKTFEKNNEAPSTIEKTA